MAPRRPQQQPDPPDDGPVYVDEHHQRFSEFAEDYLDEDEREEFVDHLMTRHGYPKISGYGPRQDPPPDPDPEPDPEPPARGARPGSSGSRQKPYFKR